MLRLYLKLIVAFFDQVESWIVFEKSVVLSNIGNRNHYKMNIYLQFFFLDLWLVLKVLSSFLIFLPVIIYKILCSKKEKNLLNGISNKKWIVDLKLLFDKNFWA